MYTVKALVEATTQVEPGQNNVHWDVGQIRYVHDELIVQYQNNPAAFTVLSGPDDGDSSLAAITNAETLGTKNGATVAAAESSGVVHRTTLTCTATPVTISDDAGVAQYGGVLVYTLPEGAVATIGAVVSGTLTAGVTGTIINNWDGDVALGTVTATTGATLTGTEANIMPSVAVSAGAADKIGVVSAVSVAAALTESGARWLDGTTTPIPVYLNFVIDDDATHTAGTATFTGSIALTWLHLGDK